MKILSKKIFANNDQTKFAIVDDDIAETIQQMGLKFYIKPDRRFYSTKWIKFPGMAEKKRLQLHHFVWLLKTGELPNKTIDHQDRNPGNNKFSNLRLATSQQQKQNRGKRKDNSSGYIGVSHRHNVDKRRKKNNVYHYWLTQILRPDGKLKQKSFPFTEAGKIEAARYYDQKAIEYFGDFHGELNFPE